jgi:hypothetical protein
VFPNNSFAIYIDMELAKAGSLLTDFNPPVNINAEIIDPTDTKPASWDDRASIPNTKVSKPDWWDETIPQFIPDPHGVPPADWLPHEAATVADPTAVKPSDWDDGTDGEWLAPMISNPKCVGVSGCGKWTAPLVKNPKYRGPWYRQSSRSFFHTFFSNCRTCFFILHVLVCLERAAICVTRCTGCHHWSRIQSTWASGSHVPFPTPMSMSTNTHTI